MPLISIPKLKSVFGLSFGRALIGQIRFREQRNLAAQLYFESQIFNRSSSFVRLYSSYQVNKLPVINSSLLPFCCIVSRKVMAASGSHSVSGDIHVDGLITGCGNVGDYVKTGAVFFGDSRVHSCRRGSVSLRNRGGFSFSLVTPSVVAHRNWTSALLSGPCLRHYHVSCSASNGAAADVPFDISVRDEQLENSVDSSTCKNVGQRTLKLKSGSCYLPHPEKLKTGGEDAHFICEEKQVIGVADGVGGWADVGVDAGFYARLLMSNSVAAIKEEPRGSVDPAKVLEKAHANTKVIGSSTACIVALTDQGIHAINLGDSAFIVIREGSTVFRSPVQQYGFNFPYQLANGDGGDLPSSGQVFTFPVASGDVLVAGTDGLFDNMYDNEISALVVQATRSGLEPKITAQNIANLAQQRAQDRHRQTPFSTAAHDAGVRYMGGKLDDITVVVSYITGDI
ncbi:hypothetical protein RND81_02G156000 [Saponaria officinalis]|uniref:Protein phosphatase n=1 Tax=Saponaria officinalis TaxID=3572 RepID=A0AAW1MME0_SAPOF